MQNQSFTGTNFIRTLRLKLSFFSINPQKKFGGECEEKIMQFIAIFAFSGEYKYPPLPPLFKKYMRSSKNSKKGRRVESSYRKEWMQKMEVSSKGGSWCMMF